MRFILYSICILVLSTIFYDNDRNNSYIVIKYIPFTTETPLPIDENDLIYLNRSLRKVQIKEIIVESDSLVLTINKKISLLKNGYNDYYNLRMQCYMYQNSCLYDSFYVDNKRRLVYSGKIYNNDNGIINNVLNNICRPLFSYISMEESLFWNENMEQCNDSLDFISTYGRELFEQTDWQTLKRLSKEMKKKYQR